MSENEKKSAISQGSRINWRTGLIGGVIGFVLCGLIMFAAMPSMMIVTKECKLGFDETIAALQKQIPDHDWVIVSGQPMDMNKSMAKHGVTFAPRVKLIKLCKPEYAKSVLETDRHISCMMPCTLAVWEADDGKVYLSKMNLSLMAKMFGGNVAKIMGGNVVKEEEKILSGLLKN